MQNEQVKCSTNRNEKKIKTKIDHIEIFFICSIQIDENGNST